MFKLLFCFSLLLSNFHPSKLINHSDFLKQDGTSPNLGYSPKTIILNTNLISLKDNKVVPNTNVYIQEGIIYKISQGDLDYNSQEYKIIDGTGKYLMPGLADMHTHIEHPDDLIPYLANGITTVMNLGSSPEILNIKEEVNQRKLVGPEIFAAAFINGQPPGYVVKNKLDAVKALQIIDSTGWDLIKIYNHLNKESLDAVVEAAQSKKLAIVGHGIRETGMAYTLTKVDAIAHEEEYLYSYTENRTDYSFIPSIVNLTKSNEVFLISTLSTYEAIAHQLGNPGKFDSLLKVPEMKYVREELKSKWRKEPRYLKRKDEIFSKIPFLIELIRQMHVEKVQLMVGTDTPFQGMVQGFSYLRGLEFLKAAGLSNYEVLKIACVNPGIFIEEKLGVSTKQGKVLEGWRANLILLEKNPLEDLKNLRTIVGIIKMGEYIPYANLESRLENLSLRILKNSDH